MAQNNLAETDHKSDIEVGRELAEWREMAGLSQDEAAKLLDLASGNTISRWETGLRRPRAGDYKRAMGLYREKCAERQSAGVPRGTVVSESPVGAAAAKKIRDFEIESARAGATDEEIDHIHASLTSQSSRSFYLGGKGEEELDHQIEGLRVWLKRRIEARKREERHRR